MTQFGRDTLLGAGYKSFEHPLDKNEFYVASYQKRIEDDLGTKYFVNFTHYRIPMPDKGPTDIFDCKIQMRTGDGIVVNLSFGHSGDLEKAEKFVEEFWTRMNMKYYDGPEREPAPAPAS